MRTVPTFTAALFALIVCARAAETRFRVMAEQGRAAVRVEPNADADAVGRLAFGAEVVTDGTNDAVGSDWVRIQAPEEVSLWIYAELLRNGAVAVSKAMIRTGAGIGYKAVAKAERGTLLDVRGSLGDWLRIKPPPGTVFWISRHEIEPLALEDAPPEAPQPADAPVHGPNQQEPQATATAADLLPESAAAPPRELHPFALAPNRPQGVRVTRTGRLDWPSLWDRTAPGSCRLIPDDDGGAELVIDRTGKAEALVGSSVRVHGTRWFLTGVAAPVLVVDTLIPL